MSSAHDTYVRNYVTEHAMRRLRRAANIFGIQPSSTSMQRNNNTALSAHELQVLEQIASKIAETCNKFRRQKNKTHPSLPLETSPSEGSPQPLPMTSARSAPYILLHTTAGASPAQLQTSEVPPTVSTHETSIIHENTTRAQRSSPREEAEGNALLHTPAVANPNLPHMIEPPRSSDTSAAGDSTVGTSGSGHTNPQLRAFNERRSSRIRIGSYARTNPEDVETPLHSTQLTDLTELQYDMGPPREGDIESIIDTSSPAPDAEPSQRSPSTLQEETERIENIVPDTSPPAQGTGSNFSGETESEHSRLPQGPATFEYAAALQHGPTEENTERIINTSLSTHGIGSNSLRETESEHLPQEPATSVDITAPQHGISPPAPDAYTGQSVPSTLAQVTTPTADVAESIVPDTLSQVAGTESHRSSPTHKVAEKILQGLGKRYYHEMIDENIIDVDEPPKKKPDVKVYEKRWRKLKLKADGKRRKKLKLKADGKRRKASPEQLLHKSKHLAEETESMENASSPPKDTERLAEETVSVNNASPNTEQIIHIARGTSSPPQDTERSVIRSGRKSSNIVRRRLFNDVDPDSKSGPPKKRRKIEKED